MSVEAVAGGVAVEVHEFRRRGVSVLEFGTQEHLVDRSGSGAQAITMLENFASRETSEEALLASVRAAARAEAHAAGLKARYAARLSASQRLTFATHTGTVEVATEEIALTLRVTRVEAERLIGVGRAITGAFFATGEALDAGKVTFPKAWVIADCLGEVPLEVALPVEAKALERAPERTAPELRRDIERMLIEADPDHADDRAAQAVKKRCVGRPRPGRDGMARMSVFLPAPDAVTLDGALDSAASAAHAAGDTRTVGQLRADTLTAWAATAAREGTTVTTTAGETVTSAPVRIAVTVPLEVLARALPGFTPPPSIGQVLHAELTGHDTDTADTASGLTGGHRTEAATLEGYGPIAPALALFLAAGGTWQRIVTDTLTGAPLDVGRTRYTPPAHLATLVRLRDHTCIRPGCAVPAHRCQTDHVTEWAKGGPTSARNLASECPRDHAIKSAGAGTPGPLQKDGTRTWTSALGHTYTRPPEREPRHRGHTPAPPPDTPPDQFDGPPPY
ncbi:MAG: DUF222 domain-containing protein [Actinomycetota bacterium]